MTRTIREYEGEKHRDGFNKRTVYICKCDRCKNFKDRIGRKSKNGKVDKVDENKSNNRYRRM